MSIDATPLPTANTLTDGPVMNPQAVDMRALMERLYPICRSITGNGVRQTLAMLAELVPVQHREVATGTQVFDWHVPKEWNIRDAYVAAADGRRVIDFRRHSLHVLNYAVPVRRRMSLAELRPHLFTLPNQPDLIPYRTSYYNDNWGFCLAHRDLLAMPDGDYDVVIDTTLQDGALSYGELVLPGQTEDEILLSTHICHPSMVNDNLSGIVVLAALAERLASRTTRRHTVRILFVPGTIGSITWLAQNEARLHLIKHGLCVTGVGDPAALTYKKSRRGNACIDRAASHVLSNWNRTGSVVDFEPFGYDERQYCSPGINLPVGRLARSKYATYPQYHTSGDDLHFVTDDQLQDALAAIETIIDVVDRDATYLNLNPKCEPQLGRRGLYRAVAGQADGHLDELALLWVLNLSDGQNSLLDIAEKAGRPFAAIARAADALCSVNLLAPHTSD